MNHIINCRSYQIQSLVLQTSTKICYFFQVWVKVASKFQTLANALGWSRGKEGEQVVPFDVPPSNYLANEITYPPSGSLEQAREQAHDTVMTVTKESPIIFHRNNGVVNSKQAVLQYGSSF